MLDSLDHKPDNLQSETHKKVTAFKSNRLFFVLGGFFLANALIAEFIGVKIFSLEGTLGLEPFGLNPIVEGAPLSFTAGVLLWPIVFIMTDIINEYFGISGVRFLSFIAAAVIAYAFVMIFAAIGLAPDEGWWQGAYKDAGVPVAQDAYRAVFGQGMWIIVASIIAFLVGQFIDAVIFKKIKEKLGEKRIWLRATLSTLVSQFIDSYLVLYIAFVIGADWSMTMFFAIGTVNYIYKVLAAVLLIPLLYVVRHAIESYLGPDIAKELKEVAMEQK